MVDFIPIRRIYLPDGTIVSGKFIYRNGPVLMLESGEELSSTDMETYFEMTHELVITQRDNQMLLPMNRPILVFQNTRLVNIRRYAQDATEDENDIFPPSSHHFFGKIIRGKKNAIYVVQECRDSTNLWLTIIDCGTNEILESFQIKSYEYDAIRLKTYSDYFYDFVESFSPVESKNLRNEIIGVIDRTNLSWDELFRLSGGNIPISFVRGSSARESIEQLVPIHRYPEDTREEILAFLVWAAKEIMPDYGISEFVERIRAFSTFRGLFLNHLRIIMNNQDAPAYLILAREVVSESPNDANTTLDEGLKGMPNFQLFRIVKSFAPDWQNEIVEITKQLTELKTVTTRPPVPRKSTPRNIQRQRFIVYDAGLRLRANVRPEAIGLKEILYLGAAHRWPHWHLAYSIRLGSQSKKSPYLQGMIMTPSAAEQVKRVLPNIIDIDWSTHVLNLQLYSQSKKRWTCHKSSIDNSFDSRMSLKKLKSRYGYWKHSTVYHLNMKEARIIDLAATMFFLSDLDMDTAKKYWKVDTVECQKTLTKLRDEGIIDILYWFNALDFTESLSRVYFHLHGREEQVCSIVDGLLRGLPTSWVKIAERGTDIHMVSRIPIEEKTAITELVSRKLEEMGLPFQVLTPSTHRNYQADLYQRLLNPDGSWNSDVSAFLSQVRSVPKSLLQEMKSETIQP
jgi:hypothetical protein